MIEDLFINILEISITSAAAIAVILGFSKLAENSFRKKWRYWVWVFIAVYLVIPMKMDFPNAPIKVEIPPHEMIITEKETFVPEQNPYMDNSGLSTGIYGETGAEHAAGEAFSSNEGANGALSTENSGENTVSTEPRIFIYPIVYVGAVIWAVGAVLVCGWNVAMYFRFSIRSKPWNREVSNTEVLDLFERIKDEMGVPARVRLYENRLIKSPMMVGFFNPRVLLPSEQLLPGEYEFVLRHELTHYKRGDIYYKFLMMLAASVHWFNPMVGTMCGYAENDIEITCDEAVVKAMEGDRRQEYCATILNIMRRGQNSPLLLSTSFYGGAKVLKKRFSAVLEPRTHRGIVLFIIAVLIVIISGMMVACGTEGNVPAAVNSAPANAEEASEAAQELIEKVHRSMNTFEENDFGKYLSDETENYIENMVAERQEMITSGGGKLDRYEYKARVIFSESLETGSTVEMLFQVIETYYYGSIYSEDVTTDDLTTVSNAVKVVYDLKKKEFTVFLLSEMGGWIGEEYYNSGVKADNMASSEKGKTEEEIISGAKTVAIAAYYEISTASENNISLLVSETVEKYIDELSAGKQGYIAENGIDIDYGTYTVYAELFSAYETESGMEVLLAVHESYRWDDPATAAGYIEAGEKSHAKLVYNADEDRFTDFVIYGITWMGADYFVTLPAESDPRPVVSGPDENGIFPVISNSDWDRWVTYNGISDLAEPEKEVSSVLECKDFTNYLAEKYPETDDWKIVYERGYYGITNCYDPYSYSFRNIYMPRRFAVLETEQAEGFDRLVVFTYESYAAVYVEGGIEPRLEMQFRSTEAFAEDIDADFEEAVIPDSGYVLPTTLWFPAEKKMVWFNSDGAENEAYLIEGINKELNIVAGAKIFSGTDLSGEALAAPEGRERDMFLYIDLALGSGREKIAAAYYDYETKTVDIYEDCIAGENEVFPQIYFLDSNTLVISADGNLRFYRTYAHSVMTESFAEIGGNGKGLSEGKTSAIQFVSIDGTKGGRYMFIYTDEESGKYSICTFDKSGNILSDFSLGLDFEGTVGSASYKSGIVYFSYYPAPYSHENYVNYAVDSRPEKSHKLQANAW